MDHRIIRAIANMNLIQFNYEGGTRTIEPHCYGITTADNEGLRAYQVGGYSSTDKMGWKMFDLGKATEITILEGTFPSPRPGYKKRDKGMKRIFQEL